MEASSKRRRSCRIFKKLLHKVWQSEYTKKESAMLLIYVWAKTGRGDGITWSGFAAPFLFPKTNSERINKAVATQRALQ